MRKIQPPLTRAQAEATVQIVEAAIAAGAVYPAPRGANRNSAVSHAANALGLSSRSITHRLLRAAELYGLAPNGIAPPAAGKPASLKKAAPRDVVADQRLRDENARLRREQAALARRVGRAEDLRGQVFGLTSEPLAPVAFPARDPAAAHAETIVLFLSDLHWGESVDIEAMDGANAYSLAIAQNRLARWAQAVVDLATKHWSGPAPERIILLLGGDMISGEIHAELAKTNDAKALPAVRDLVAHLTAAIRHIRRSVACPLDIISLPGNHGRSTMKPESKQSAETSYDTLTCDFLESTLQAERGITFYKPPSGDALFNVYGWSVFATHGDRIGSRGGMGDIGPAATASRGFNRITREYAHRGKLLDLILIGHFHTPMQLEAGFVNGSLPGPTEYSRDGRFRPHPAQQLFLTMHPHRKIAQVRWIHVGTPDEGTLYAPPPAEGKNLPRYKIKAVTERVA